MTAVVDYTAEVERSRRTQGLPAELPDHVRGAVAAILALAPVEEVTNAKAS